MEHRDQFGFTLVELLVVLAVIAVIMAILFPVFAQAREKAQEASCFSNLRQIALASEVYAQEYDETLLWNPPGYGASGESTSEQIRRRTGHRRACVDQPITSWVVLLQPYLKSEEVFLCPSFPSDPPLLGWLSLPSYQVSSYGLNAVLSGDDCQPRSIASLHHAPSEVALIGDSAVPWSGIWLQRDPAVPWPRQWPAAVSLRELDDWPPNLPEPASVYWGWQLSPTQAPTWGPELHSGGSNFAFADGHAKFLRPSQQVILRTRLSIPNAAAPGDRRYDRVGFFPGALLE
jgi:prepilin-type N-terminal cleavage/methylation domain-containing protein/prepilin-type processing-associated H-X9-DG protein